MLAQQEVEVRELQTVLKSLKMESFAVIVDLQLSSLEIEHSLLVRKDEATMREAV